MPFTKITANDKKVLLDTARHAIQYGLTYHEPPKLTLSNYSVSLQKQGHCFVTLRETSKLRGCMGSLSSYQPLAQDVAEHAFAAAFKDPRFPPVNTIEEPLIHISISVLSEPQPIIYDGEQDLIEQLNPEEDGVILEYQQQRATYLPSVWEQLPEPAQFIRELKRKAGLNENFWDDEIRCYRYTTTTID